MSYDAKALAARWLSALRRNDRKDRHAAVSRMRQHGERGLVLATLVVAKIATEHEQASFFADVGNL